MGSYERLQVVFGLLDALEADIAAEDNHGFKERRRILASANCDPDGLKHRPGFQTELDARLAQRLVERIMIEGRRGQDF